MSRVTTYMLRNTFISLYLAKFHQENAEFQKCKKVEQSYSLNILLHIIGYILLPNFQCFCTANFAGGGGSDCPIFKVSSKVYVKRNLCCGLLVFISQTSRSSSSSSSSRPSRITFTLEHLQWGCSLLTNVNIRFLRNTTKSGQQNYLFI